MIDVFVSVIHKVFTGTERLTGMFSLVMNDSICHNPCTTVAGTMLVPSRSNPCYVCSGCGFIVKMGKERLKIVGRRVTYPRLFRKVRGIRVDAQA